MEEYAAIHGGYTYTSSTVMSKGVFDINAYKASVQAGKPVALFLSNFAFM